MARPRIGTEAMTPRERMAKMRAKARAELEAIEQARAEPTRLPPPVVATVPCPAPRAVQMTAHPSPPPNGTSAPEPPHHPPVAQSACTPPTGALDLLTGEPDAVAEQILKTVPTERGIEITAALQRKLWQRGSWAPWRSPILS